MMPDRRRRALFRKYKSINGLTYPSATARLSRVGSQKKAKDEEFQADGTAADAQRSPRPGYGPHGHVTRRHDLR
jgi:hypothetical protein